MLLRYVSRSWRVSARKRTLGAVGARWRLWATLGLLVSTPLVLLCCRGLLIGAPLVFWKGSFAGDVFISALLAYTRGPLVEAMEEECFAVPVADEEQGTGNGR